MEEEEETTELDEETEADEPVAVEQDATDEAAAGDASVEALLAKKPEDRAAPDEDDDEQSILSLRQEERVETLTVKVVPQQPTEFVCRNCYLVKHRSQLADKKRMFCRDCA